MDIFIIGNTGHTNYVVEALQDNYQDKVVGIAPGSEGEEIESLYNNLKKDYEVKKYELYQKALDELQPDVAVVASHFGDHSIISRDVLQRDIHLFVEKPVATTLEGLELLKKEYKESQSELSAMLGLRYTPWFQAAHKKIDEGAIGDVRLISAQKSYKLGQRKDFYKKRGTFGGTIPWVGIHAIDWMHWLGNEECISVYASHSTKSNNEHGDLESTALCHFEFTNEVFGSLNIDYLRPETAPTHGDDRIRVAGNRGIIEVLGERVYLINDEVSGKVMLPLEPKKGIFTDFLNNIRKGGVPDVSAKDSFLATKVALKARKAADKDKRIEI